MIRISITYAAIASLCIHFCNAQEEQKISLQFLAFPAQANPEPIELLVGESKTIPIETPGNELSAEYKISRPSSIVVGVTTANEKGEPIFQVLGKSPTIASQKQIILLLRKGGNNSDGFTVVPVDGELVNFSGGSYLFINVSQLRVGGIIGDKKFALDPGERNLLKPAPSHVGGGCQVTLAYQKDEADTKGKKFYDTRWAVNARYRTLVFFYQDPVAKSLGVAPIVNFL